MFTGLDWVKFAALIAVAAGLAGLYLYFGEYGDQAVGSAHGPASMAPADAAIVQPAQLVGGEAPPATPPPADFDPSRESNAGQQRTDAARAEPAGEPEPQGPFSISGMVVDEAGMGAGGIEVVSRLKHAFGEQEAADDADGERAVLTDIDGFYEIRGVADGEYVVQTEPTDRYETARAMVRAGSETADLVLRERRPEVLVFGTALSEGVPLDGVEVAVIGQSDGAATDSQGNYELKLEVAGDKRGHTLRFAREGYREVRATVDGPKTARRGEIRVDAEMEPVRELVDVSGTVVSRDGEPIPDQSVQLYSESARQRHTAVTRTDGRFWLEDVETSSDYLLAVYPEEHWRDFKKHGVEITLGGVDLEVVLEPRALGRLSGRMVDPDGQPVPLFSLWLRNRSALNSDPLLVTGDQQGVFRAGEVEAGELVFETRSSPLYSISGIRLADGEEKQVTLVLDQGAHQVSGLVMDDGGRPVAARELFFTSVRSDNGLRAHAVRRAVTDQTGFFLVDQVGSGYHTIRIDAPGYRSAVLDHVVGMDAPEVIIRLERESAHGM
jgi:hypothetical protein